MKTKINLIISIFLISILVFSFIFSSYAVTQQDLQDIKDKITEAEQERQSVQNSLSQTMKEIQELDAEIDEVNYNLTTIKEEINKLTNEITQLEKELEQKTAEYEKKYDIACKRIVAQYKSGNISYLDILLKSTSLTNLLSNYYMLGQVVEADEAFLDELTQEKERIASDKASLEEKKQSVEEEKQKYQKEQISLTNKKNAREKKVSTLTAEEKKLRTDIENYYDEYAKKEEEFKRIAQQSGSDGGTYTGGQLGWPCPSMIRISSYFGSRSSPLAGGSSYHKGIDMAAPMGSAILAAESGTVIAVYTGCAHNYGKTKSCGCGGGFGNYVMVNHGSGLVTVYAHCTSINVKIGDKVSKGDKIATVGTTGASTGAHLHFGVLLNGSYVNPASYIGL